MLYYFCSEIGNLRLTAPLQFDLKILGNFRKEKQATWTEVKKNLKNE